ncbi:hypothetical protein FOZ76_25445 [Verticiella sediminum]|uniref:Uncharacterized protein n=1 Tax=Verticiella sediminum TaxID=1247510 RepID=A0A556A7Y1_9BURK|nr:biofilm regulation protein kinase SiaB [Verticiella sediminum]TSH88973.1 hypothetical protein FOZ76_25445 [Verticiella sediminum]
MNANDLYALRTRLFEAKTLLCFNGPISRSLLEEFGLALKSYLATDAGKSAEAMDVFSVYIEITQNIRRYVAAQNYEDARGAATVVISRAADGHYVISAGNIVQRQHGRALVERIETLAGRDKTELKALYKQQRREPRDPANPDSAGLGLLEIARRATAPMQATLVEQPGDEAFFGLSVTI